jgi:tetratricopeptide (TPR) repeat protein
VLEKKLNAAMTPPADLGAAYGQMGMLLMAAAYRDEAESALLAAQTFSPRDPRWPYYLGHLYKLKGDAAKSNAAFARALELAPDDVATLIWSGEGDLGQGAPDAARTKFEKALSLQPRSAAAQFGLGRAAIAKQDYARAVDSLEKALSLDPQATVIHDPLAAAYGGLGNQQKAQVHLALHGTVALTPADPLMQRLDALLNSSLAYEVSGADALDRGDVAGAADSFRKGIEVTPKDPSLHHKLGAALALAGDGPGAMQQFTQALALDPNFVKAHYSLGVMQASLGQTAPAMQHFSSALKVEPGYAEARLQLAHLLRRTGQFEASLPHYNEVVKTDPRVADAWFGYAAALIRLRRYADARDYLAEAMRVHPAQVAFASALARVLSAAPDDTVRDGARAAALMQVVVAHLRASDLLETMAMAQAELGQFTEAVRWQKDAVALAQKSGEAGAAMRFADNLRLYESRRPCRTPWRPDEPIEFQATSAPQAIQSPNP